MTWAEEILLWDNAIAVFLSGNAAQTLDIEDLVEKGTDRQFELLLRQLATVHAWIVETCLKLNGVAQMLRDAYRSRSVKESTRRRIILRVQCQVAGIFGTLVEIDATMARNPAYSFGNVINDINKPLDTLYHRLKTLPKGCGSASEWTRMMSYIFNNAWRIILWEYGHVQLSQAPEPKIDRFHLRIWESIWIKIRDRDNLVKIAEKDVESYITGRRATYEYARVQRRLIHHFKEVAKYHLAGGACDPIHEVEGVQEKDLDERLGEIRWRLP